MGFLRFRLLFSRMDEDLFEFREKVFVSVSCICRERWSFRF